MKWQRDPPTRKAFKDKPLCHEEYYWVRGWTFNRPVIARVTLGARRQGNKGLMLELNYQIPASRDAENIIWEGDFQSGHDADTEFMNRMAGRWSPLEWAGPIPRPNEE